MSFNDDYVWSRLDVDRLWLLHHISLDNRLWLYDIGHWLLDYDRRSVDDYIAAWNRLEICSAIGVVGCAAVVDDSPLRWQIGDYCAKGQCSAFKAECCPEHGFSTRSPTIPMTWGMSMIAMPVGAIGLRAVMSRNILYGDCCQQSCYE